TGRPATPSPSKHRKVRIADREPAQPHGDPHALQPSAELHRVSSRQDQNGLSDPHHAWPVDESGLLIGLRDTRLGRRVLPSEDQVAYPRRRGPVAPIDVVAQNPQVPVVHRFAYAELYNSRSQWDGRKYSRTNSQHV